MSCRVIFFMLLLVCSVATFCLHAASDLLHDIQQLSDDRMSGRKTATSGAEQARSYIQQRFFALGLTRLKADFQHPFHYSIGFADKQGINLIASLKGCSKPDSYIVMTAHYDHLGKMGQNTTFYGANDNASGVVMMLDLAKKFKKEALNLYQKLKINLFQDKSLK